jgi:hypothetical protein
LAQEVQQGLCQQPQEREVIALLLALLLKVVGLEAQKTMLVEMAVLVVVVDTTVLMLVELEPRAKETMAALLAQTLEEGEAVQAQ